MATSAFTPEVLTGGLTDSEIRATPLPVSGSVSVSNLPATQPVSGTVTVANPGLTDAQLRLTPVPVSGSVTTSPVVSNSPTLTRLTSNSANQTALAANANRKKFLMYFDAGVWDIKFGAVASPTSRTLRVDTGKYLLVETMYTGQVDVFCTTSGKFLDITELV